MRGYKDKYYQQPKVLLADEVEECAFIPILPNIQAPMRHASQVVPIVDISGVAPERLDKVLQASYQRHYRHLLSLHSGTLEAVPCAAAYRPMSEFSGGSSQYEQFGFSLAPTFEAMDRARWSEVFRGLQNRETERLRKQYLRVQADSRRGVKRPRSEDISEIIRNLSDVEYAESFPYGSRAMWGLLPAFFADGSPSTHVPLPPGPLLTPPRGAIVLVQWSCGTVSPTTDTAGLVQEEALRRAVRLYVQPTSSRVPLLREGAGTPYVSDIAGLQLRRIACHNGPFAAYRGPPPFQWLIDPSPKWLNIAEAVDCHAPPPQCPCRDKAAASQGSMRSSATDDAERALSEELMCALLRLCADADTSLRCEVAPFESPGVFTDWPKAHNPPAPPLIPCIADEANSPVVGFASLLTVRHSTNTLAVASRILKFIALRVLANRPFSALDGDFLPAETEHRLSLLRIETGHPSRPYAVSILGLPQFLRMVDAQLYGFLRQIAFYKIDKRRPFYPLIAALATGTPTGSPQMLEDLVRTLIQSYLLPQAIVLRRHVRVALASHHIWKACVMAGVLRRLHAQRSMRLALSLFYIGDIPDNDPLLNDGRLNVSQRRTVRPTSQKEMAEALSTHHGSGIQCSNDIYKKLSWYSRLPAPLWLLNAAISAGLLPLGSSEKTLCPPQIWDLLRRDVATPDAPDLNREADKRMNEAFSRAVLWLQELRPGLPPARSFPPPDPEPGYSVSCEWALRFTQHFINANGRTMNYHELTTLVK